MSRLRVVRMTRNQRAGFTQVANSIVRPDGDLSAGAVGVLVHLLSHVEGWDVSADRLAAVFANKLPTIKALLQELERAGHLERRRWNTSAGFVHEWVVHEEPIGHLVTDGLTTDGLIIGGGTADINKTIPKKTRDKKTKRMGSAPPSHGSSADFEAIENILDEHGGGDLDAVETWEVLRRRHRADWPVAWLRTRAETGELDGFISTGALEPLELDEYPVQVSVDPDRSGWSEVAQ